LLVTFYNEFKSSIKSPDTEEKLDLVLYRPLGFLIAKISMPLSLTPTMLSIMGLICGIVSANYYLEVGNNKAMIIASIYLVLSGIFDSADGQLARISNQSTKLGLILDGICDSIVMIAVYGACAVPLVSQYGPWAAVGVFVAIYLHSYQCAILDFYHREYLFFGYGKTENDTYWNPSINNGIQAINNSTSKIERTMNSLRLAWIKKQQQLTTRTDEQRQKMRNFILNANHDEKENFMKAYKKNNLWLLPYWRLIGVNAHTFLIILFMLLGRFDLYLIIFDVILFNVIIYLVGLMQKSADKKFFAEVKL
jgi:hypothetical protein